MKTFMQKHPICFTLLFTVLVMQALGFATAVIAIKVLGQPVLSARVAAAAATTIAPLIFVWRMGWWEDVGLGSKVRNLQALTVPLVLTFFPLVFFGTTTLTPARSVVWLLAFVFTGISEEVVYRGMFLKVFQGYGRWRSVLASAVIFGSVHIVQSLDGHMPLQDNLVQILNAFFSGVLLGAVRLRIDNIWPLIVLHTLVDLLWATSGLLDGVYQMSDVPLSLYLVRWVPSVLTAVYLMRAPASDGSSRDTARGVEGASSLVGNR